MAVVVDRTTAEFFWDGVSVVSRYQSTPIDPSAGSTTLPIAIDEVALFNRPLSASEVQAIFAAASQGMCKSLAVPVATPLPDGLVGEPASDRLQSSGGVAPVNFTLLSGDLPPGMTLASDGTLSGTPPRDGSFTFTVQATDSVGQTATGSVTKKIPPFSITSTLLPDNLIRTWASHQIETAGGFPPLTFTLDSGTLPPGMNLSSDGLVNGIPVAAGTFTFTVHAVDSTGLTATGTISKTVEDVSCLPPPPGLAHWWPGDGHANDLVGGLNGILRGGATFGTGKVYQAFRLDGVDDFIEIGAVPDFNSSSFTVSAWVNIPDSLADDRFPIISSSAFEFAIGDDGVAAGAQGIRLTKPFIDSQAIRIPGPGLTFGRFHHVVAVQNSTFVEYYVDGVSIGAHFNATPIDPSGGSFTIGKSPFLPSNTAEGLIDEVALFNRPLSASEVPAIFNARSAGICQNRPPQADAGPDQAVDASSPAGASVTLDGTQSTDPDGDALTFSWSGPFGVTTGVTPTVVVPIGTYTISLTVTDPSGASATDTVTVTVRSPSEMTKNLIDTTTTFEFQQGFNLLQKVLDQIATGNTGTACNQLSAFANAAQAQSGKKLTAEEANQLIDAANQTRAALGCS